MPISFRLKRGHISPLRLEETKDKKNCVIWFVEILLQFCLTLLTLIVRSWVLRLGCENQPTGGRLNWFTKKMRAVPYSATQNQEIRAVSGYSIIVRPSYKYVDRPDSRIMVIGPPKDSRSEMSGQLIPSRILRNVIPQEIESASTSRVNMTISWLGYRQTDSSIPEIQGFYRTFRSSLPSS